MTYRSTLSRVFAAAAFTLATAGVSHADTVVFSNFGPGFSYDGVEGNPIGNAFTFDGSVYAEGDTFKPTTTTTLKSIDIALSCVATGLCPDSFTVELTANSADAPGAVIESFTVSGTSLAAQGSVNPPVLLSSVLNPTLTAGTQYWVAVLSDSNDSISWGLNTTGDTSDQAQSYDGGASYFSPSGVTPGAYQINAPSAVVVGQTPEPASLVLLASGMLSMLPAVRRRRR